MQPFSGDYLLKKTDMNKESIPGSFRDPSGFLFQRDGILYRQVNAYYKKDYDYLIESGLYDSLVNDNQLIPHDEVDIHAAEPETAYKIIKPEIIPYISYPYEWSYSQLKNAALLTLEIQKKALDFGMSLKDCSAYNVQFKGYKPVFIDTLSFERYDEGQPWVAYRQYCQHFIASIALMSFQDIRLNQLFRVFIDGIPLDLASSLLPLSSKFIFSLLSHIHLHAKSQKYFSDKTVDIKNRKLTRVFFLGMIDNMESAIKKMKWQPKGTEWAEYYEDTNYSSDAMKHKQEIVTGFLKKIAPLSLWDLGANEGMFSRISSSLGINTISFDIDPASVEKNYIQCMKREDTKVLPLLLDLTNPSSGIGWANRERMSFLGRGPADTVLALALIHHLVISNNVPVAKLAEFFSEISTSLVIEFVPKSDSQVKRLLSTRKDIFADYSQNNFENEFNKYFDIQQSVGIKDSERRLYWMQKKLS